MTKIYYHITYILLFNQTILISCDNNISCMFVRLQSMDVNCYVTYIFIKYELLNKTRLLIL